MISLCAHAEAFITLSLQQKNQAVDDVPIGIENVYFENFFEM